ncbi:MAG TPA: DUF6677 family protein [Humisphaera sp.]|nr:DUF6677 family protein [Humisphaera sp.]
MAEASKSFSSQAPLVALVSWLVPGGGYFILGQKARGLTVGITILAMFFAGLLIAGVRCLEVPGYTAGGNRILSQGREDGDWVLTNHPLDEIRSKPWTIAQIMAGPVDILCDMWSLNASRPIDEAGHPLGVRSHSHTNEIGVLYTAVAGMLNLLAIIDATHRAGQTEHK